MPGKFRYVQIPSFNTAIQIPGHHHQQSAKTLGNNPNCLNLQAVVQNISNWGRKRKLSAAARFNLIKQKHIHLLSVARSR